jgi:8-oxo-dGTP diphosphatase/2-hydroxy-dATP diphosphatase
MKRLFTLCIVEQDNRILLGMKKRGFGAGRFNGFGGKVNGGESIEDAARREVIEEAEIIPRDLLKLGILTFSFENETDLLETHVYKCTEYEGKIGETEEMRPSWFLIKDIPFDHMWKDDIFWFPLLLENKMFIGRFHFNDRHELLESKLQEVTELP